MRFGGFFFWGGGWGGGRVTTISQTEILTASANWNS